MDKMRYTMEYGISEIKQDLIQYYLQNHPQESADVFNAASTDELLNYLNNCQAELAGKILSQLQNDTLLEVLDKISEELFLRIFQAFDIYKGALMLSKLEPEQTEDKLNLLPQKLKKEVEEIMTYPPESAGFLMDTRIFTFYPQSTVDQVLIKLRERRDKTIFSINVIDTENRLLGRVSVQKLAISPPDEILGNLLEKSVSVHVMATQEDVVKLLTDGKIVTLPVVDLDNHLLGVIRHDALLKATESDATEDVQAIFGAGREERALSKPGFAIRKRLPWLEINLATAFLAASVVGIFEETIAKITVLAVFLPVVAGQSGNTGSQALAVTIRGLALREIRVRQWLKVARKELIVGTLNGIAVALTTSLIVYFWASSIGLALVIGISMIFSMAIAGFSGAVIPIILKAVGQDPAQSSSIVLTTVTDIVGFLSFLGLATAMGSMIS